MRPFTRWRRPRDPAKRSGVAPVRSSEFGRLGILNSGLRVGARFPSLAAELSLFPGPPAPKITVISSSTQISSASLPLNCNLSWAQSFNLELNRKCRGAAPPRAVVIHFQRERRYAHTFSNHPVSNNDRESRPGGAGGRRPQSSSRAPAIPVKNFVCGTPKRTGSECLHRSTSRPANARVLPGRGRHANTLPEVSHP